MRFTAACLLATTVASKGFLETIMEKLRGSEENCDVPADMNWGPACRMRELCGTSCAEGECKWAWGQDQS